MLLYETEKKGLAVKRYMHSYSQMNSVGLQIPKHSVVWFSLWLSHPVPSPSFSDCCLVEEQRHITSHFVEQPVFPLSFRILLKWYENMSDLRFSRRWIRIMPSSEMLRRVALIRTDFAEEGSASIIRVTVCELGNRLAVTNNRSTLRRNTI
jgi:hypothetical protein